MTRVRLTIAELGPKGDGIAEGIRGPIFLDRTAPGDEVDADIFRDAKGVMRGEVSEFLNLSPFRSDPSCPHYEICGNCTLQHLSLEFYEGWKKNLVREAFLKWDLKPKNWLPQIFLKGQNRRRATFSMSRKKGKFVMGYYQRRSKTISPIPSCEVTLPDLIDLKNWIEPFLSSLVKEGQDLDLFFQKIGDSFELVFQGLTSLPKNLLDELASLPPIARISLKTQRGIQVLFQKKNLIAQFGPLKVPLPPATFLQPTAEGERALVSAVIQAVRHKKNEALADLFCGAGTFSGPLLDFGEVSAYESNPHAVRALKEAGKNEKLNVQQRDLFIQPLSSKELNRFDTVVFDPPRAGCLDQAKEMARSHCPLLVGVSCNPATFARDSHHLIRGGYRLESLQLVDQFLWSHHVEIVGVFTKQKR
ncbi:MAG: class I SAM-dependent RNA methyltransferase [Proteobacteria bacterium]|nr:class I SAM-dependent RNA methyltransferase [Pseudomonadota bacterium]